MADQAAFRKRFNHAPHIAKKKKTVQQNSSHETSLNRNKENSARRRTAYSEENIERVKNVLEKALRNISARRNGMGLSAATFKKNLNNKLRW